jgi:hypothetical protein
MRPDLVFNLNLPELLIRVLQVNRDGSVESIPGCENFPDTHASVLGKEIGSMPDTLTT